MKAFYIALICLVLRFYSINAVHLKGDEKEKREEELIKKLKAKNEKTKEAMKKAREKYKEMKKQVKKVLEERKGLEGELDYFKENIEKEKENKKFYNFFNSEEVVLEIRKLRRNIEALSKKNNFNQIINYSDLRNNELHKEVESKIRMVEQSAHDVREIEGRIRGEYLMKLGELQEKIASIEKENFRLEKKLFELENKRDSKVIQGQLEGAGLI